MIFLVHLKLLKHRLLHHQHQLVHLKSLHNNLNKHKELKLAQVHSLQLLLPHHLHLLRLPRDLNQVHLKVVNSLKLLPPHHLLHLHLLLKHQNKQNNKCTKPTKRDQMLNSIWNKQREKKMRLSKCKKLNKTPQSSEILWPSRTLKRRIKLRPRLLTPPALLLERKLEKTKKKPSRKRLKWPKR